MRARNKWVNSVSPEYVSIVPSTSVIVRHAKMCAHSCRVASFNCTRSIHRIIVYLSVDIRFERNAWKAKRHSGSVCTILDAAAFYHNNLFCLCTVCLTMEITWTPSCCIANPFAATVLLPHKTDKMLRNRRSLSLALADESIFAGEWRYEQTSTSYVFISAIVLDSGSSTLRLRYQRLAASVRARLNGSHLTLQHLSRFALAARCFIVACVVVLN